MHLTEKYKKSAKNFCQSVQQHRREGIREKEWLLQGFCVTLKPFIFLISSKHFIIELTQRNLH